MKSDDSCRRQSCPQARKRRERREKEKEGLTSASDDPHRCEIVVSKSQGAAASIEKIGEEHQRLSVIAMSSLRGEEGVLIGLILRSFDGPRTSIPIETGEGEYSGRESSSLFFF